MERNFTNENMEEFLRRNADDLRMRPSARVWKGISTHLNWRRRRRTGLIFGISLLLTTALGYYLVNESAKNFNNQVVNPNTKTERTVVMQQPFAIQNTNKQLTAAKRNPVNKINNFYKKNPVETQEFSFIQTLLQQNEETARYAFTPTIVDSYVDSYFDTELNAQNKSTAQQNFTIAGPLSIESVLNTYKQKIKKLGWQIYFTPTVSYRKLNNNYIENQIPNKPALGFELGVAAKYTVSKNAKLRAGLQFNVNRYEIKTFDSYGQLATIRLNDRNGVDYVRTITSYNNFSGYQSNWIQNFYFQVSTPVGLELKLKGDDKVQFGIASTLQPTYLIGDRAYVISSNYQNYAKMPDLVRRWNVNTSLETFVSYSTGHLKWQVGPQVRYQILSSYLKKYPVKENLFDFGLKVGVSFNRQ